LWCPNRFTLVGNDYHIVGGCDNDYHIVGGCGSIAMELTEVRQQGEVDPDTSTEIEYDSYNSDTHIQNIQRMTTTCVQYGPFNLQFCVSYSQVTDLESYFVVHLSNNNTCNSMSKIRK
jgi:hypothetical protein